MVSSTPAGYVYHFSPHAEPQPISLSLTSEDNLLISYLPRRGAWLRCYNYMLYVCICMMYVCMHVCTCGELYFTWSR